ncbi:putative peptidoglycan binding protein [Modicisalibacter xianhensis]|uniref:Putative peptidoglycan binding protein n=1 Tax=Modicisalibacter xianhensis TaxID=442341 RepID=A0A4R8FRC1_9GAMM|nr:glycosyl hydrolase 108 family protein [Halomonas xianhensis]TDX29115.1 putative peptidoglycan binding protein [Halomonas xianhensis]
MTHPLQQRLIAEVIDREGGYVDHPSDRGGPTKYGITQVVAKRHGYTGAMCDLPRQKACDIYAADYWHSLRLDNIALIYEPLAEYLFDFGVNSGPGRAGEELQHTLNVLNDQQRFYRDMKVDGVVGPITLSALRDFNRARGDEGLRVLAATINACRIAYCRDMARQRQSQEAFAYGWFRRVVELGGA